MKLDTHKHFYLSYGAYYFSYGHQEDDEPNCFKIEEERK